MQPPCRGILVGHWTVLVEYAVSTNAMKSIADPNRYPPTESLNADSDFADMQSADHCLKIEPRRRHRCFLNTRPITARGRN